MIIIGFDFQESCKMQFLSYAFVFGTLLVQCMAETVIHNLTHALSKCGGKERADTLLDVSRDFINKAKNLYPNCVEDDTNCRQKEKSLAFLDVAMSVISEVTKGYPTCPDTECPKHVEKPIDCLDILHSGKKESGVYTIWPRSRFSRNKTISVYCDMDTDGGGWTVIQRRGKFSTPKDYFYKDWEYYKNGFGNLKEEFWLGNDNIFTISNQAVYTIRFDLIDDKGKAGYAEYRTFWIENEDASYILHIEGYKGNAGNSMIHHNKQKFSTGDRKNNPGKRNCAVEVQGAWWYESCVDSNPNGLYQPGINAIQGCTWYFWKRNWVGLSGVEMKLR